MMRSGVRLGRHMDYYKGALEDWQLFHHRKGAP